MNNGSLWKLHSFQQMYLTMLDNVLSLSVSFAHAHLKLEYKRYMSRVVFLIHKIQFLVMGEQISHNISSELNLVTCR